MSDVSLHDGNAMTESNTPAMIVMILILTILIPIVN
jgi:hypothetical protein